MSSRLVRLYPRTWRARYGDEFEALIEARQLGPFDVADVVMGAVDARLRTPRLPGSRGGLPQLSLRVGGYAAVFGGILWAGSLLALVSGGLWAGLGAAGQFFGTLALVVALACLGAFQARRHPILIWSTTAIATLGSISLLIGMVAESYAADQAVIGPLHGWELWFLGLIAMTLGSGLFGLATMRVAALSRPGAALLAIGSGLLIGVALTGFIGLAPEWVTPPLVILGVAASGTGWTLLGLDAYRRDPLPPGQATT